MFKPNSLLVLTILAAAPLFAQTVAITVPANLSCMVNGTPDLTFGIVSATFSATNSFLISGSGPPQTGKPAFADYKLTKQSDACSIPFFTSLAQGTINSGILTINYYPPTAPNVTPTPTLTVYLKNFSFTSLEVDNAASEVFSIGYESIEIYDPATRTHFCWNQVSNSTGSCPLN